jgi:hypothetical protein
MGRVGGWTPLRRRRGGDSEVEQYASVLSAGVGKLASRSLVPGGCPGPLRLAAQKIA